MLDKYILGAVYNLVCKSFTSVAHAPGAKLHAHIDEIDRWIDCWVGCAAIVVQDGKRVRTGVSCAIGRC